MADGVLDERLQKEVGHGGTRHLRVDAHPHVEPVGEPHELELDVAIDEHQLALERDLLFVGVLERQPQQVAELLDHQPRLARRAFDVGGNRIQRVEQEMRIELRAQRREPRLGQRPLQIGRADLAILQIVLVVERDAHHRNRPIDEGPEAVGHARGGFEDRRADPPGIVRRVEEDRDAPREVRIRDSEHDAQRDVHEQPPNEGVGRERELAVDPVNGQ